MPHIIVKILSGRSDKQKQKLAEVITKVVMKITGNNEDAVSVSRLYSDVNILSFTI